MRRREFIALLGGATAFPPGSAIVKGRAAIEGIRHDPRGAGRPTTVLHGNRASRTKRTDRVKRRIARLLDQQNAIDPGSVAPVRRALKNAVLEHGLRCDEGCTADAARILRVPGTWNL